jgi:TolA-binding protein
MRKLVIVAVLAAAALGSSAACASSSPDSSPTSAPATTAAAADQTKEICAQAIAEGTSAATQFSTQIDQLQQDVVNGDTAKATELETTLRARINDWQAKLQTWSTANVNPQVKSVLTDAAATVKQLNDPNDQTAVNDVKAKFLEIGTKLFAACGT